MEKNKINNATLINSLKNKIYKALGDKIKSDYVLWDLPYHKNIGDILIWEGTLDFLKNIEFKMLNSGSRNTAKFSVIKSNKTTILLQGGGNFGDIYRSSQDFRNSVIQKYPDNPIIILPQSIYYSCANNLDKDSSIINAHSNLTICVRDLESYRVAKEKFVNSKIELVPDMAFYMDPVKLKCVDCSTQSKRVLFLNRNDVENKSYSYVDRIEEFSFDSKDWPTFDSKHYFPTRVIDGLLFLNRTIFGRKQAVIPIRAILDSYMKSFMKNHLLRQGVFFLNEYDKIYTTRLHVCILGFLLNKEIVVLDNSYGKLSSFYECWLKDGEKISLIK